IRRTWPATLFPYTTLFRSLIGVATARPAHAQGGVGLRGGLSVDPDQFYVGVHVDAGPLVDHLWFRPNVEIGLGDDRTLFAFNAEDRKSTRLNSSHDQNSYV